MDERNKYIDSMCQVLDDFCIDVTKDILKTLSDLYPNEIAIERYVKELIKKKLGV